MRASALVSYMHRDRISLGGLLTLADGVKYVVLTMTYRTRVPAGRIFGGMLWMTCNNEGIHLAIQA